MTDNNKTPTKQIAELLGTDKKEEQLAKIQKLTEIATLPVLDIVVRYDPRTNDISINTVGVRDIRADMLKMILHRAVDQVTLFAAQESARQMVPDVPVSKEEDQPA